MQRLELAEGKQLLSEKASSCPQPNSHESEPHQAQSSLVLVHPGAGEQSAAVAEQVELVAEAEHTPTTPHDLLRYVGLAGSALFVEDFGEKSIVGRVCSVRDEHQLAVGSDFDPIQQLLLSVVLHQVVPTRGRVGKDMCGLGALVDDEHPLLLLVFWFIGSQYIHDRLESKLVTAPIVVHNLDPALMGRLSLPELVLRHPVGEEEGLTDALR
mmetsp:Transcript_41428/g.89795  ORF Transcript_41428/g.89795 Transcript_41428/m.89795 type:complete len:212 (-) Transcript_41428:23-658(-)